MVKAAIEQYREERKNYLKEWNYIEKVTELVKTVKGFTTTAEVFTNSQIAALADLPLQGLLRGSPTATVERDVIKRFIEVWNATDGKPGALESLPER